MTDDESIFSNVPPSPPKTEAEELEEEVKKVEAEAEKAEKINALKRRKAEAEARLREAKSGTGRKLLKGFGRGLLGTAKIAGKGVVMLAEGTAEIMEGAAQPPPKKRGKKKRRPPKPFFCYVFL